MHIRNLQRKLYLNEIVLIICTLFCLKNSASAQLEVKLYPNGSSLTNGITETEMKDEKSFVTNVTTPRMYAYFAPKEIANGTSVLICPGGGYRGISVENEGSKVAQWFNQLGITAFVLYYRMPNQHSMVPLTDAQTAINIIRSKAKEWNINKNKLGIMGFSAGGHLASTVGTHFTKSNRPDFLILVYPVITMNKEFTHAGSRINLIGENPTDEQIKNFSNELQVNKNTPSTFLVLALDDKAVVPENSYLFHKALQTAGVPSVLHTYDIGGHGFGMRKRSLPVDNWTDLLQSWLFTNKLIK